MKTKKIKNTHQTNKKKHQREKKNLCPKYLHSSVPDQGTFVPSVKR